MLKIYGSLHCRDCVAYKAVLDAHGTAYEFVDITGGMPQLKEFLALRDHSDVFERVREKGTVGIPCIVEEDGTMTVSWKKWLAEHGYEVPEMEPGQACSLDGKGC